MRLKTKIIIIFGILFICFGLLQIAINQIFILPSFITLENDEAIRNLNRVNEAINKEIRHLDDQCYDWGAWDDSYSFMKTGSQEYKNSNLSLDSFATAGVNLIIYMGASGKFFWGKIYDLEAENEIRLKGFTVDDFSIVSTNLKLDADISGTPDNIYKRGILLTEKGPIMLAARPILLSDKTGPARGTLIMGRFLTQSVLDKIKEETKVDFNIYSNTPYLPQRLQTIINKNSVSFPYIEKKDQKNILMYEPCKSIQGEPAFLIEVNFPREITRQGIRAINYSLVFLLVAGLIILSVILKVIKNVVITPIINLAMHMEEVETGNYHLRLGFTRKDIIGKLASSFDKMIAKIESQTIQLEKLSSIDGLTGIYNRRIFDETLTLEWKRMTRQDQSYLSAIMCDVDFFKLYNDTYGHQMGDDCLKAIASAIKSVLKRPSDFVARYGGEEYIVLLPNTAPDNARNLAESIRGKINDLRIKHEKSGIAEYVTISMGVTSVIPSGEFSPLDLIRVADQALYEAKEKGRNRIVFKSI